MTRLGIASGAGKAARSLSRYVKDNRTLVVTSVCAIVLVVFSALWGNRWLQGGAVSLLLWTLALCVHLTVRQPGVQFIYIIAGVLQALTVLWFLLKARK